jgi:hypothetical protein
MNIYKKIKFDEICEYKYENWKFYFLILLMIL